jgi:hypothetical protein
MRIKSTINHDAQYHHSRYKSRKQVAWQHKSDRVILQATEQGTNDSWNNLLTNSVLVSFFQHFLNADGTTYIQHTLTGKARRCFIMCCDWCDGTRSCSFQASQLFGLSRRKQVTRLVYAVSRYIVLTWRNCRWRIVQNGRVAFANWCILVPKTNTLEREYV